jgi:hypothetical protein
VRWLMKNKWKALTCSMLVLWVVSFLSPEISIRRYILLHLHPIQCFTVDVTKMDLEDRDYGHLYDVRGYTDHVTGNQIGAFYLKKAGPFWYVGSAGTGP